MRPLFRLLVSSLLLFCTNACATNPDINWDEQNERVASPSSSLSDFDTLKHTAPAASSVNSISPQTQDEDFDFTWIGCNLETMRIIICPCPGHIIPEAVHTEGIFWEISLEALEKRPFRYNA